MQNKDPLERPCPETSQCSKSSPNNDIKVLLLEVLLVHYYYYIEYEASLNLMQKVRLFLLKVKGEATGA